MCGVFHISDSMLQRIRERMRVMEDGMTKISVGSDVDTNISRDHSVDIHPTDFAPVIIAGSRTSALEAQSALGHQKRNASPSVPEVQTPTRSYQQLQLQLRMQRWGFPGVNGQGVIFNARQETAMDKKLFRAGLLERRAVIPAEHFYEWNANREKNTFKRVDGDVMYLAGFYDLKNNEDRFVILTTEANDSMRPVHDRMPVILEEDQLEDWIFDDKKTLDLLRRTPGLLQRSAPYEQLSLFTM